MAHKKSSKPRKHRKTKNQLAWEKEVKRIQRFMREAGKRGFTWEETPIPARPKVITKKRLKEIRELTPTKLYQKAKYTEPGTGHKYTGTKGRELERRKAAKKGAETLKKKKEAAKKRRPPTKGQVILWNIQQLLQEWVPVQTWSKQFAGWKERDHNILTNLIKGALERDGEEVIAKRLQDNAEEVNGIIMRVLYASGGEYVVIGRQGIQYDLNRFAAIIQGFELSERDAILIEDLQDEPWDDIP